MDNLLLNILSWFWYNVVPVAAVFVGAWVVYKIVFRHSKPTDAWWFAEECFRKPCVRAISLAVVLLVLVTVFDELTIAAAALCTALVYRASIECIAYTRAKESRILNPWTDYDGELYDPDNEENREACRVRYHFMSKPLVVVTGVMLSYGSAFVLAVATGSVVIALLAFLALHTVGILCNVAEPRIYRPVDIRLFQRRITMRRTGRPASRGASSFFKDKKPPNNGSSLQGFFVCNENLKPIT